MAVTRRKAASLEQPAATTTTSQPLPSAGLPNRATGMSATAAGPVVVASVDSTLHSLHSKPASRPQAAAPASSVPAVSLSAEVLGEEPTLLHSTVIRLPPIERPVEMTLEVMARRKGQRLTTRELADIVGRAVAPNPSVLATKINVFYRKYGRQVLDLGADVPQMVLLRQFRIDELKRKRFVYWMEDADGAITNRLVAKAPTSAQSPSHLHHRQPQPIHAASLLPLSPNLDSRDDVPLLSPPHEPLADAHVQQQLSISSTESADLETPPPLSPQSPPTKPKYAYTPPVRKFAKATPPDFPAISLFGGEFGHQPAIHEVRPDDWDWVWEGDEMTEEFHHPENTSLMELEQMLEDDFC